MAGTVADVGGDLAGVLAAPETLRLRRVQQGLFAMGDGEQAGTVFRRSDQGLGIP
ncbi:hypothetical protein [Streptomyces sp. NPDC093094]|uniref:hypothetical protein n=1 Tax=Streptomyces sp. NPDC093094 TaxID=3366026 RepID=UPI00382EBCCB